MFKVGDIVKIINPGETYSTYETWIDEHCGQYKKFFELGERPTKNECGKIKYIGYHNVFHNKTLVAIQMITSNQVFVIGVNGLEKVNSTTITDDIIDSKIVIPDDEVCKYFLGGLHNPMLDNDTLDSVRTAINLCKQYDEIYNKESEETDMNKVLKLYYDRKLEEIHKKYEEKVDNDFNNIDVVKQYKTLIENFEKEQEALFKTVENFDNDYLVPSYDSNLYKYSISELKTRSSLMTAYEDDRVNEIEKLKELVEEVDAQLSLSEDLNYQMEVLTRYDILDKKTNKVKA